MSGSFNSRAENRFALLARVAVLENRCDRIDRVSPVKDAIRHHEAVGIVGMAGRIDHVRRNSLYREPITITDTHRHCIGLAPFAHDSDAMVFAQRTQFRYVVGMQMCVYRLYELEVEFADELEIAVHFFHHRIDITSPPQRLARI